MAELWDAYDCSMKKLDGMTLVRGEALPSGVYHIVCEVAVRHIDGTYLIMQRDPAKMFGGMWELTAGGSALRGEDALTGALRELREETGIAADKLTELGTVVQPYNGSIHAEYLCVTGCDKSSVTLQEGETVAYRWVTWDELCEMGFEVFASWRMQAMLLSYYNAPEKII